MHDDDRSESSGPEQAVFAALPRERDPGRALEERTVRALSKRGLLAQGGGPRWASRPLLAIGLAASVALFALGVAVGQWLGTRTVTESMTVAQERTAMQAAAAVQRAGSAYVTALAALTAFTQLADSADASPLAQGREAALAALTAAVRELVVLAPDDPLAGSIQELIERRWPSRPETDGIEVRNVVWF